MSDDTAIEIRELDSADEEMLYEDMGDLFDADVGSEELVWGVVSDTPLNELTRDKFNRFVNLRVKQKGDLRPLIVNNRFFSFESFVLGLKTTYLGSIPFNVLVGMYHALADEPDPKLLSTKLLAGLGVVAAVISFAGPYIVSPFAKNLIGKLRYCFGWRDPVSPSDVSRENMPEVSNQYAFFKSENANQEAVKIIEERACQRIDDLDESAFEFGVSHAVLATTVLVEGAIKLTELVAGSEVLDRRVTLGVRFSAFALGVVVGWLVGKGHRHYHKVKRENAMVRAQLESNVRQSMRVEDLENGEQQRSNSWFGWG